MTCLYSCPIDQTTVTLCAMQHRDPLWLAFETAHITRIHLKLCFSNINGCSFHTFDFVKFDFFPQRLAVMIFLTTGCFVCLMKTDVTCFPILKRNILFQTFHNSIFLWMLTCSGKNVSFCTKSKYIPFVDVSKVFLSYDICLSLYNTTSSVFCIVKICIVNILA